MSAQADLCESPQRLISDCSRRFNGNYQADLTFRFWPVST